MTMIFIASTMKLGHYTPLYKIYFKWIPGISIFRLPARSQIFLLFSMSILAGFGFQHLREMLLTKKQHATVVLALLFQLVLILGAAKAFQIPVMTREILLAVFCVLSAFFILHSIRFLKNKQIVILLILAGLFIDPYMHYSSNLPIANIDKLERQTVYEKIFNKDPRLYPVNFPFVTLRGMKYDYYNIAGYSPILLDSYYKFIHKMAELPDSQLPHAASRGPSQTTPYR